MNESMNEYGDANLNLTSKCLFDADILKAYIKLSNIVNRTVTIP